MTSQDVQEVANKDFLERAKDFDMALKALKESKEVELGVMLNPANFISKLLGRLKLIKIKYNITILDNKKIDGISGETKSGGATNS